MNDFSAEAKVIAEMFPQFAVDCDGYWGTPRVVMDGLVVSLDQGTPAIAYIGKTPEGYHRFYRNDPDGVYRLLVAKDATVAASIYGPLYAPETLADLYRDAKQSGAIQVAVALFGVPCHIANHKWFVGPDTFKTRTLRHTSPEQQQKLHDWLTSFRS